MRSSNFASSFNNSFKSSVDKYETAALAWLKYWWAIADFVCVCLNAMFYLDLRNKKNIQIKITEIWVLL